MPCAYSPSHLRRYWRRAPDALLLFPFADFHWFALHARVRAMLCDAGELNGGPRLRRFSWEEQVIELAGLGVNDNAAGVFR